MTNAFKILSFVLLAVGIVIFFVDRSKLLGFLPFLFILACPFMHLFMHSGYNHGSGGGDGNDAGVKKKKHGGCH